MITFSIVLAVIGELVILYASFILFMFYRNDKVYNYRQRLLDRICEAAYRDAQKCKSHEWRFDMFRMVSYEEMVDKFWKPLDSFYPDKSFLE